MPFYYAEYNVSNHTDTIVDKYCVLNRARVIQQSDISIVFLTTNIIRRLDCARFAPTRNS